MGSWEHVLELVTEKTELYTPAKRCSPVIYWHSVLQCDCSNCYVGAKCGLDCISLLVLAEAGPSTDSWYTLAS